METPIYPPAIAFEQPIAQAEALSIENYSLGELIEMPAAWAIVVKHMPALQRMIASPMIKPHLGNFTVRTMEAFVKGTKPETYAAMNDELSRLPEIAERVP